MGEEQQSYSMQIFHELGKLTSSCESIIRETSAVRSELNTRSSDIIKQLADHMKEDDARFKPLENAHWRTLGIIAAVTVFWIVVMGLAGLYLSYRGTFGNYEEK